MEMMFAINIWRLYEYQTVFRTWFLFPAKQM